MRWLHFRSCFALELRIFGTRKVYQIEFTFKRITLTTVYIHVHACMYLKPAITAMCIDYIDREHVTYSV